MKIDVSDFSALSFDCYGTLVDWEAGMLAAMRPFFGSDIRDTQLLAAFAETESVCQKESPGGLYPAILAETHKRLAEKFGLEPNEAEAQKFGNSIGDWPVFADTVESLAYLRRHFSKLVILSNVDNASIARTLKILGVSFDAVLTAQNIGSYKPDLHNFEHMIVALQHMGIPLEKILHVSCSPFHDIVPAQILGLHTVYVNRPKDLTSTDATPSLVTKTSADLEIPNLEELAKIHQRDVKQKLGTGMEISITDAMDGIVETEFKTHPFNQGVNQGNAEGLLANYLTMSILFPHVQERANGALGWHDLINGGDLSEATKTTVAVGAFLAADERNVVNTLVAGGMKALPKILDVENFHSGLLKSDMKRIFGREVPPDISHVTMSYMENLERGLSSPDPVQRIAHMVAFERHAGVMIEALWGGLEESFELDKDTLDYFRTHVGGDDPAEPYHVAMTASMIERHISPNDGARFLEEFRNAYRLSFNWCEAIKRPTPERYISSALVAHA